MADSWAASDPTRPRARRRGLTLRPIPPKRCKAETRIAISTLISKRTLTCLFAVFLLCTIAQPASAQARSPARQNHSPPHFADYDSEPRRADGHVDGEALLARLKELHVTTYYWLVWHARTDWDDLKLFLPKAAEANIEVWVYLAGDASEFRLRHGDPASPERIAEWLKFCLQAWREGKCDGVVTYCLDKQPRSRVFDLARDLFGQYRQPR